MTGKYDDILRLPHHISASRKPMAITARAAQFAPFAALTGFDGVIGYDAEVQEAGRLTDRPIEPDEYEKEALNARLRLLARHLREKWVVSLVFFQPDERKAGGAYVTRTGTVKKLYETERLLTLTDGTVIPLDDLIALDGEEFAAYGL